MRSCSMAADILELLMLCIAREPHVVHYETADGGARPQAKRKRAQADVFVASSRLQSGACVFRNSDATAFCGCITNRIIEATCHRQSAMKTKIIFPGIACSAASFLYRIHVVEAFFADGRPAQVISLAVKWAPLVRAKIRMETLGSSHSRSVYQLSRAWAR